MPSVKILFVCLGNICRSPLAEAIFVDKIARKNLTDQFEVDPVARQTITSVTSQTRDPSRQHTKTE